ncbi:type VI secretion system protein TssA [Pseudomonas sp. Bout1]|uniref:type VI secretion system protein TssA n=1 Tax=Pseudomonas sp. Bout1 TaxID=3048600 RepID=UPI002AB482D0|nr:type VI secretion system protein TssA [Pseudomonas sp. Bout1]MDY7532738.1 type VI secretion system protein TssA [Pseudomonas sp. Bout1]MEB0185144.1 type VI secretion system protein TssA [Pseudomonas sp. Bout1]
MVYSDRLSDYYLELAQASCSKASYAGADMRFSTEYEALETELGKAHSIHGNSQPDWQWVVEKSETLLRHHSKDLRVAVWLTWALHQRESFPGLLAGLGLLRYLCEHHWAVVYPGKLRTRSAAFGWMVPRLDQVLAQNFSIKDQRPLFHCMLEHLARLDELWTEHLCEEAPLLLPIRRQLADRLQQATQSDPASGNTVGVIAQIKQVAAQLLAPEPVVDNEKDAHKLLRTLQENARPLSAWWQRQNATDLRALRLNRTLTWLAITRLPDCDNEQVTPLRGPTPEKLKRYQERFAQGQFADLLLELEASLACAPFWFDGLHRAWECLQALQADLAMNELEVHFALLLQRLPGLVQLRFHDGTPFADSATRGWINTQVVRHLHSPAPAKSALDAQAAPWDEALQDVMPMLRKEGFKAAVRSLKQGMQTATGDRARFHWRLGLARLCVLAGKHDLAKVQLDHLDHELHHSGLQRWEPELAVEVLQLLYGCCDVLPQNHAVRERKEDVHRRLCHFDLEAVLE